MSFLRDVKDGLLELLFPEDITCIVCGEELAESAVNGVCPACYAKLPFNNRKICVKCGAENLDLSEVCNRCADRRFSFASARSPFVYADAVIGLIHTLKFGGGKYLAKNLAAFMADCFSAHGLGADAVVAVPLHKKAFKRRGYNQAAELARFISGNLNIPFLSDALIKTTDTKEQARLSGKTREENLAGVFSVPLPAEVKGKSVLLIDDVFTTGSTAEECAKVLLKAGAREVTVLTLAAVKSKPRFEGAGDGDPVFSP